MFWTGLRWVDAAFMQIHRFEEVFYDLQHALLDADMRRRCNEGADSTWRASFDANYEPYDPQRPISVPTFALTMQVTNELDLLIVAVRNVLRAQKRLPVASANAAMTGEDVLELLRNVAEHWDEIGGRSAAELARDHPSIQSNAIAFTNKEVWIGGTRGVPLSRIRAWLAGVNHALRDALAANGVPVPDDMSSVVAGDDELAWPEDRRRYRLWLAPTVEKDEWPTDEMPPEITDLIAERFANLRARDWAD